MLGKGAKKMSSRFWSYTHITDLAHSLEKLKIAIVNCEDKARKTDKDLRILSAELQCSSLDRVL